jgi:hypothetical protein
VRKPCGELQITIDPVLKNMLDKWSVNTADERCHDTKNLLLCIDSQPRVTRSLTLAATSSG